MSQPPRREDNRWTRKTVREYAPYTRWDWADPMHEALDLIPDTDCELFKRAYWDRLPRDAIAEEFGWSSADTVTGCLAKVCERVADLMNHN